MKHEILPWSQLELQLAILQVLKAARGHGIGASGRMLCECLSVDAQKLAPELHWLLENSFIDVTPRAFSITEQGLAHLNEQGFGTEPPTNDQWNGPGPLGGGHWRGSGPNEPSGVPNRPYPNSGAGALALSEPEPEIQI